MPGTSPARRGGIFAARSRPLVALVGVALTALAVTTLPVAAGGSGALTPAAATPTVVAAPAAVLQSAAAKRATVFVSKAKRLPVLRYGSRGPYVKRVQRVVGASPDGVFGAQTLRALKRYQRSKHLAPNGYVGPVTWYRILKREYTLSVRAKRAASRASRGGSPSASNGSSCPVARASIISRFGDPRGGRSHQGIDLGGSRGQALYAVESGTISDIEWQSNGALRLVLNGDSGAGYYYGHQDRNLVSNGQRVRAGQVIATMGDTGAPGIVHLHFEYWPNDDWSAVDPEPLINRLC